MLKKIVSAIWAFLTSLLSPLDKPLSAVESWLAEHCPTLLHWVYTITGYIHTHSAVAARWLFESSLKLCTQVRLQLRLALGLTFLCAGALWMAFFAGDALLARVSLNGDQVTVLRDAGIYDMLKAFSHLSMVVAGVCLLSICLTAWKNRITLILIKVSWAGFSVCWIWLSRFIINIPTLLYDADYKTFSKLMRNEIWMNYGGLWLLLSIIPLLVLLTIVLQATSDTYRKVTKKTKPALGDRIVENVRSGGEDPRFRSSAYWAATLFLIAIAGPFMLRGCGWEDPYDMQKGGTPNPVAEIVKIKKKKQKKKVKMVVNAFSPYIFEQPNLADIKVLNDLDGETNDEYEAQTSTGKMGIGESKTDGWPSGIENARVRFIRLRYSGGDWDQDMGKGADYNLLIKLREMTGLKIASKTEALDINRLRRFPKDKAPPFVFMTGKGGISLSAKEIQTLRWYCLEEGGCLFIDNGGGHFDRSVRKMLSRIFPGKPLRDIGNDDLIYQAPYQFKSGAPPFWSHSGDRAMGVRHNGRWVVYYHQGDINDAWKDGHSGENPVIAEQAYKLGVNVINYSFNQYYRIHFGE